ncbi:prenyltransferase/squalene oxidase repeat-containing protein [Kitasatospora sp. NPDC050543]|uniref:prenyltransferase/squalene oxidase repeat-containing protein n=1 Tax=Kitasatospora sp. NPDC050543 TaxID=3364054 RepID=UPI00378F0012
MRAAPITANLPRWSCAAFPVDLAPATDRLRCHLEARIEADGAVRSPCHSRVLESALLAALLDRTGLEPEVRARIAGYLAAHRDSPRPLDRLLARAALGDQTVSAALLNVEDFLAHPPDFTSARKHALLHAVLLLLGTTPATGLPAPEAFSPHGLHTWARVQVTAVKAILAHAYSRTTVISAGDVALLRSTQHPGTVWEGNLLIHLFVLHALTPLPGMHGLVAAGIRTALTYQRPDGGLPFIGDEDTWVTAAVALHTTGAPPAAIDSIAQRLRRLQHPSGGWSYTEGAQLTDVDCTSAALEALHLAGPDTHRTAIRRAVDNLSALRAPDGGYPTYLAGAPQKRA